MKILIANLSSENSLKPVINSPYGLGISYLHSALEIAGHEVITLPMSNIDKSDSDKQFIHSFLSFMPDIVAFSLWTANRSSTFEFIEYLNKLPNPPKIIIGGIHATVLYDQILQKYNNVIAVLGEGDITIVELVQALKNNQDLHNIKGIAFYQSGKVIKTENRELIEDLDTLPFPKHELYFDKDPVRTTAMIISSRGCPSRCTFCCNFIITHSRNRRRSASNVIEEIKYLKQKYPRINKINIIDDTFLVDNQRVIDFCKQLINENLNLKLECTARVKPVSTEMFYWMEKAGFNHINFGLETGCQSMLYSIKKNIKTEDVIRLVEMIKPFNIEIYLLIMCGFPGETWKTVKESTQFIQSIQRNYYVPVIAVSPLFVSPGTAVYETMKEKGFINDNYWMQNKEVPYYIAEYPFCELQKFEKYMMDRIGIKHLLTLNGIRYQLFNTQLLKYILKNKQSIFVVIGHSVKTNLSFLYDIAPRSWKKI